MLRAAALYVLALLPLTAAAHAEGLQSFRVTHLERGRHHDIKNAAIDYTADASKGLISSSQVGITLCDEPGRNTDRFKPRINYKLNGGNLNETYRCVSVSSDKTSKRYFTISTVSAVTREGSAYHLHGKMVIMEKGEKLAEEVHTEDAIVAADGTCKLTSYERVNDRPNLAISFSTMREPEKIVTTSESGCEWR